MDNVRQVVIQKHFIELSKHSPGLALTKGDYDLWIVRGILDFSATYEDVTIRDKFETELSIPEDYPDTPPVAKETGRRIPKEFHTNQEGSLCLGAPLEIRMKFSRNPSLLGFVNEQVIPFLFSFCYWEKNGEMPFDELPHGGKGIIEYYAQLFNVTSDMITIELLKILAEDNYRGHHYCPCNSGKIVRHCHGEILRKIGAYQNQDEFLYDYIQCLTHLQESGQKLPESLFSKKLMNRFKKYNRAFNGNQKRGVTAVQKN